MPITESIRHLTAVLFLHRKKWKRCRFVEIATTRPETLLGDTAVAVNPEDERYKHLVGKMAILPIIGREIPIFADDYVDKEFGTGCVKTTPCHDPNDFEMGQRHNLEQILVFNEDATVNENGGKYQGMDRYACRKAIVADLEAEGYRTFAAYNGREALAIIRAQEIHLVLMDIMMPVMDGLAATRAIRSLPREDAATVPIIATTAKAFTEDREKVFDAGMNEYLTKPIDFAKLHTVLAGYRK